MPRTQSPNLALLQSCLLMAWRNLLSRPLLSLINIVGLALGLACVLLIALFVRSETGYDTQWTNADRTWRVMRSFNPPGGSPPLYLATNAPPVGPLLQRDFPQFEHVVRLMDNTPVMSLPDGTQSWYEPGVYFADPDVFAVFDIPLLQGNPEELLTEPYQLVINASLAQKYFGDDNAVGQTLLLSGQIPVQVTGVMADLPENTHLDVRAFASMQTAEAILGERMQSWGFNNFHTYVVTEPGYDIADFKAQIPDFLRRHVGDDATSFTDFSVIKLTDIHLNSHRDNELQANGNGVTVLTFSAIAVFILLIACFNFMNLSTATSMSRAREVGMRKVCGASRGQIAVQFLLESVVTALIAVVLAAVLLQIALPAFNALLDKNMQLNYLQTPLALPALLGLASVVGVLAGSYPALFLSSFPAVSILKDNLTRGTGGVWLRKALVIVQFAISIALVIASGIAMSQLRYAQNLDLGFDREQVLIYRGSSQTGLGASYQTMKQELLRHSEIVSVTAANLLPGDQNTNADGIRFEGGGSDMMGMGYLNVDHDFFETFGIRMLSGRAFSRERSTDLLVEPTAENPQGSAGFILNELAARQLGWTAQSAPGKWFESIWDQEATRMVRGTVIGVVDNIHFSSLREEVKPVYYRLMNHDSAVSPFPNLRHMAIRVTGNNMTQTLAFVNETWNRFLPGVPIQQSFLDADLAALYETERRQGQLFTGFAVLAVVIAVMGLFGLASSLTRQRTREIGIRKVLGSSTAQLVTLLTREFVTLVLLANGLAWPLAWYFMSGWLESFAYRVAINPALFLLAGLLTTTVAAVTVGLLVSRKASINPVLSLRHE
ncbi:MAG: ABC transporter permease [Gammaproteobacteria bacterium]|nr:ABC transporter permease [Gammaproteobacteria bacterium]